MGSYGFGFAAGMHRLGGRAPGQPTPPLLSPSASWDGTAGSGFVTTPTDPTRTTAKPAAILLTPPDQHFADELTVGVMAMANANGTLIGGIDRVRFQFEGNTVDVSALSFRTFTRYDGSTYECLGYWVTLKKGAQTGAARLYATVIPSDATMQNRVLGPYLFHPTGTLHDASVTVGAAGDYTTIPAAIAAMKTAEANNPLITVIDSGDHLLDASAGGSYTSHTGYFTIAAAEGVNVVCKRSGDNDRVWRPLLGRAWFKNIRFDYSTIERLFAEGELAWVMDRCDLFAGAAQALWFHNVRNAGETVSVAPWFLETRIFGLANVCNESWLARGCQISGGYADVGGRIRGGLVHNQVDDWRIPAVADKDTDRMRIQYSGSGSVITMSRAALGTGPARYRQFTIAVDGVTAITFDAWERADKRFDDTKGYYATDFADAINAHADFTATVLPDDGSTVFDRIGNAVVAMKLNIGADNKDFHFTDHVIGTDFTMNANFEFHADFVQGQEPNRVVAFNRVTHFDGQGNISLNGQDTALVGNIISTGLENRVSPTSQFDDKGTDKTYSHFMVAHNTWQGQRVLISADTVWDAYSMFSNNVAFNIGDLSGDAPGTGNIIAESNVLHVDGLGLTLVGDGSGSTATWFADEDNLDFTPAGPLLTNLVTPVVSFDLNADRRGATAPAGAVV